MFREMRRYKQQISAMECRAVLKAQKRAVLSVLGDEGYPYGVPVNFYYDEAENTIYIHGAGQGHKLDAIRRCPKVCFTVCDDGIKSSGDWAYTVTSVIAMGTAEPLSDTVRSLEKIRMLGQRYYPTPREAEEEIARDFKDVLVIAIHIDHMTGKRVKER